MSWLQSYQFTIKLNVMMSNYIEWFALFVISLYGQASISIGTTKPFGHQSLQVDLNPATIFDYITRNLSAFDLNELINELNK